jgi:pyruvate dehydrogenase E2 component (dihydrolipoamide acetyltransferase)
MLIDMVMPKCGLTMREGTIVRWVRREGDAVAEGDPVLEIETDKAIIEVPAMDAGTIIRLVAEVGSVVPVGDVLAILEGPDDSGARASELADTLGENNPQPTAMTGVSAPLNRAAVNEEQQLEREGRASPLARRIARELRVNLARVYGTGPRGLVTEADVRAAASTSEADISADALRPVRTETLSGMRKAIAVAMSQSIAEAPQVTLTREAGMAGVSSVRKEASEHVSITDVILATVAHTLVRHPRLNAHLIGDELRLFEAVNIALAVALEDGLVTPVFRNVRRMSLAEIATHRRQLVDKAHRKTLRQAELEEGTFTITNLGVYGIDAFTPILNQPQVAILGIGAARPRPSIFKDSVVIRDTCPLSLTFDHRALDGAPAALFLADLANLLDDPDRLKKELY